MSEEGPMTPHFYDPFDENAPSFLELNKRRRSCLAIAADASETNKKLFQQEGKESKMARNGANLESTEPN